jgi:hypothetical protein
MYNRRLHLCRSNVMLALALVLYGCTPPVLYTNFYHPSYGAQDFKADLAQCQTQGVTIVATSLGYDVQSGVGVDVAKANACMAIRGWEQAPPLVTGYLRHEIQS